MSKEEFLKIQKCVLKVNIHCDGCKQKVKKILQKIDGVFTIEIDAEAGKVTVSGNVDPAILIKKLSKSKKYAEIWGAPKVNPNTNNGGQQIQMKNLQIENGKDGAQKGANNQPKLDNGGGRPMQISPQMLQQMQLMNGLPQLKGLPMPPFKNPIPANKKAVKFDLPEEDDLTDDDDDYDDDDYDNDYDDDLEDDLDDTPAPPNKMKPLIGGAGAGANAGQMSNTMMMNGNMNMDINMQQLMNAQKAAMGPDKKPGGGGAMPMPMNGLDSDSKGGKRSVVPNGSGTGNGDDGKKGETKIGNNNGLGAGHGNGMPAGGMATGGGGGVRPMGSMKMPMAQMGNMQMSQMGSIPSVHGLPAAAMNSSGYFSGAVGPTEAMGGNPYQQQQYMAAMMNHHRPTMVNQPMMYARPPSAVNYLPPYPYPYPPQPGTDNYSHVFSDENTSSCNVM